MMSPTRARRLALGTLFAMAVTVSASLFLAGRTHAQAPGDQSFAAVALPRVTPFVFDGDVRDLPQAPSIPHDKLKLPAPRSTKKAPLFEAPEVPNGSPMAPMPSPVKNFAGLNFTDACTGGTCGAGWPPDINGDVGPTHYIEAVNDAYAIYSKATGALLASFTENSLWAGTGAPQCDGHSFGDPVVIYDALADRWILSNFAFSLSPGPVSPFYQCLAVSKTSDPVTGGWYLYPIRTDTGVGGQPPVGTLNDYGKLGIWTDCLYFAANGFLFPGGSYNGSEFASFSRSDMYSGAALTMALGFLPYPANGVFTMIPSNLAGPRGRMPPVLGTPNYFTSESISIFAFEVRKFTAGANCGGGGSLGAATVIPQTSYDYADLGDVVPQPAPATGSNLLDSLDDRLMQKVQYRKVDRAESLWITHTFRTTSSGPTGSQWAQIDVTGGTVATTALQQQKYDPADGIYRWMSSVAADKNGNVALGYSTSNGSSPNFPSVAYSGRLAGDPANTLPQTETQLIAGGGSQVNSCGGGPCHRWGDYTAMSIDPDGCTYWYTNEYYDTQPNGTSGNWHTRIGSFKFLSCVVHRVAFDFNGDFKTDFTVFRPSNGVHYTALSSGGARATGWGVSSDIDVPADYDGDGKVDIAVFRPTSGLWFIIRSSDGTVQVVSWGVSGDIPMGGDVDGDGKADQIIWRPSSGTWYINKSGGGTTAVGWGVSGDQPLVGDFDGDGKMDLVIYRPSSGAWYLFLSMGGTSIIGWGIAGDIPVIGDWDGDGRADEAVFRPSTGQWLIKKSSGGTLVATWGISGDIPLSGDMDGDGLSDFVVWRPSSGVWFILFGAGDSGALGWGISGDKPAGRVPGS